jgi:hypothetical protein
MAHADLIRGPANCKIGDAGVNASMAIVSRGGFSLALHARRPHACGVLYEPRTEAARDLGEEAV